jgi:glucose/arabinose dehydrogenase
MLCKRYMPRGAVRIRRAAFLALLFGASQLYAAQLGELALSAVRIKIGQHDLPAEIPAGFKLEALNLELRRPRMLAFAADGSLWIGSGAGLVYRLEAPYTQASVIAEHDDYPHGVAFRGDEVFLATTSALLKAKLAPGPIEHWQTVIEIPGGSGHNSRTVRIGPDQRVYLSLGIRGNCSAEFLGESFAPHQRRGGVMVLDERAKPVRWLSHASGLRNPVGFDWHPHTGVMYASNNGPDHHGFEQPPESFAKLDANSFHGMPWFQWDGKQHVRDECVAQPPPRARDQVAIPAATFPARSAPMAVAFAKRADLGGRFDGDAVVAIHGSWGTQPDGSGNGDPATRRAPRLALVRFVDGKAVRVDDFVRGFQLEDGRRWARPVGAAFGPDGALYFTSDGGINGLFRLQPGAVK